MRVRVNAGVEKVRRAAGLMASRAVLATLIGHQNLTNRGKSQKAVYVLWAKKLEEFQKNLT